MKSLRLLAGALALACSLSACGTAPMIAGSAAGGAGIGGAVASSIGTVDAGLQSAAPAVALMCSQVDVAHLVNQAALAAAKVDAKGLAAETKVYQEFKAFCASPPTSTAALLPTALNLITALHQTGTATAAAAPSP